MDLKKTVREKEKNTISSNLPNNSPVANRIVQNYLNSPIKEPGGHCLSVSKNRFENAYKEVHGHLPYQDLPDSMATATYMLLLQNQMKAGNLYLKHIGAKVMPVLLLTPVWEHWSIQQVFGMEN